MENYWISYVNGTITTFYAKNRSEALWYFMMEGDHAWDWGLLSEAPKDIIEKINRKITQTVKGTGC